MNKTYAVRIIVLIFIVAGLLAALGCDSVRGSTSIYLEGISVESLATNNKPIEGLPIGELNVVELKVPTNKVHISSTDDGAIITLNPSGATITISPDGMSVTGVEPDQIEMKWQSPE